MSSVLSDLLALTKPGIVFMVLITTAVGFYVASPGAVDVASLLWVLGATGLIAAGTLALNQYIERDVDARMPRTQKRPLPAGRLQPKTALLFGSALTLLGLCIFCARFSALTLVLALITIVSYLAIYTPLKRYSSLCTIVGAVPGAIPPLIGWSAVDGRLDPVAWIVFAMLFLWQFPHSLAIAKLYRDDYERGGVRMLPVIDASGKATSRQIVLYTTALWVVGLLPALRGVSGWIYFGVALISGALLLASALRLLLVDNRRRALELMFASQLYLPLTFIVLCLNRV